MKPVKTGLHGCVADSYFEHIIKIVVEYVTLDVFKTLVYQFAVLFAEEVCYAVTASVFTVASSL